MPCRNVESNACSRGSSVKLLREMPQSPPERKFDSTESPRKASVVPFERPQSDAQRTVRQRVQERLDREGVRIKPRVSAKRVLLTLAVALIPVILTFTSADAVLRRIQLLTRLYTKPAPAQPAPAEEPEDPGVVIMMPDPTLDSGSAAKQGAPSEDESIRNAHAGAKPSTSH
jgi:hypothetical protein